ncbi:hypothetical protein [Actinosynnema sp. NPDC023587]|uniref:hypothetical protein n=1 Tax=Actinosynnema sp. NPDC023587 TaxID=3154695 RepID=UPI0033EDDB91
MTKLVATVTAEGPGQWWSTFDVSRITNVDGSPPVADEFLLLNFKSPAPAGKDNVNVTPWVEATLDIVNKKIGDALYDVTIKVVPVQPPYQPGQAVGIKIGVAGDLRGEAATKYLDSFLLYADEEPVLSGTAEVAVAACPDEVLAGVPVEVGFTQGEVVIRPELAFGTTRDVALLPAGTYAVSAKPVATEGETVAAPVVLSTTSVTVAPGQTQSLSVGFGPVVRHGALDVTISRDLEAELGTEALPVRVVDKDGGAVLKEFTTQVGRTTPVRGLPPGLDVEVRLSTITVNNVEYTFKPQDFTLGVPVAKAHVDSSSVTHKPVDTTGFIPQQVVVTAEAALSREFLVRFIGTGITYAARLAVATGPVEFPHVLKPGRYAVAVENFLDNGTVYPVKSEVTEFDASPTTPLKIGITTGAHLLVPGFPAFLSFGACADLTPGNVADFAAARASSIFKYAGVDGAGDDDRFLDDDTATRRTIDTARDIEKAVGGGHHVLPVMISYTCNLSLGDTQAILLDADRHMHSYGNYILALSIARDKADPAHPVAAAFVVNPDFLGACQQENLPTTGSLPKGTVPVRKPLEDAIRHAVAKGWLPAQLDIPESITEDINGYVRSVNWLTRAVAGTAVSFGWVSNLWGVGASNWVYLDGDVTEQARSTADYTLAAGTFDRDHAADFHAIDRYEADDLTERAYRNGYCYGPREWVRYYQFCAAVGERLKQPVMPWQIPASRLPATTDAVGTPISDDAWGTGGSYLFGHPEIGDDVANVNPAVRDFALPATFPAPYTGKPVSALFTRQPFDWSAPAYGDFPLRGIFSVLLGGGATTGIVGGVGRTGAWTAAKTTRYLDHPIPLTTSEALVPEQYTPAATPETVLIAGS